MSVLEAAIETARRIDPIVVTGRVEALRGLTLLVRDLSQPIGTLVAVSRTEDGAGGVTHDRSREALGQVVGFTESSAVVMMLGTTTGIRPGDHVQSLQSSQTVGVGPSLIGRVVNGLGEPIDGHGPVTGTLPRELDPDPVSPLKRSRVTTPLYTGVRALDLCTTLGRGQRIGLFAGPGVGKSTLMGEIARGAACDVSVIALIGERGREVRDFVDHVLGPQGLSRAVVVAATGDESPVLRVRAALAACAIAEGFRDMGKNVLLMMDSATRFAHAQRQIGLAIGEPPATRGYTPSVFAHMARLLERAGALDSASGSGGSITGVYTVLVEGDDMTEPVADAARGILDGHIILSRALVQRAHYPAIDVLDSVSRVADEVCDREHISARRQIVRTMAAHKKIEDLVQIGAYAKGSSPEADVAIDYMQPINTMLRQEVGERESFEQSRQRLVTLSSQIVADLSSRTSRKK